MKYILYNRSINNLCEAVLNSRSKFRRKLMVYLLLSLSAFIIFLEMAAGFFISRPLSR